MPRKVCLAIGVSTVTPPEGEESRLAYLDGAVVAAEAIGQWALHSRFGADNVRVVTDGSPSGTAKPVTAARLQSAVDELFPSSAPAVEHLILAFCGHGLTGEFVGSMYWLFSDALEKKYKVHVDALLAELVTFGVKRITLIADACRDAPPGVDLQRLDAQRGIIGRNGEVTSPKFDRLAACQDTQKTYMVGDRTSAAPGKCILSGVVLDVLWGHEPAAFTGDVIDTIRFAGVARQRAEERAAEYGLQLQPQSSVDPIAAVLVERRQPPGPPGPPLQEWPAPSTAALLGQAEVREALNGLDQSTLRQNVERLDTDEAFRKSVLGPAFGLGIPGGSRELVTDLIALRNVHSTTSEEEIRERAGARIELTVRALENKAADVARAAVAQTVRARIADESELFHAQAFDLSVTGGRVRAIWSRAEVEQIHDFDEQAHFKIHLPAGVPGAQLLVEFDDRLFAPMYYYRDLFAIVSRVGDRIGANTYGARDGRMDQAIYAITELSAGRLDPKIVGKIAGSIRYGKHINPMLGAIAAHLYRAVSDVDSIRRMAWYFTNHGQPVPFDIALLGEMAVKPGPGGEAIVSIPAVAAGSAANAGNHSPEFVMAPTPAARGTVAGYCPWLAMGWDYPPGRQFKVGRFTQRARDESRGLLRRSNFVEFYPDSGRRLAGYWRLKSSSITGSDRGSPLEV